MKFLMSRRLCKLIGVVLFCCSMARAQGIITTVAGSSLNGGFSGDGGLATNAGLFLPRGVAVDATGNLYIADTNDNRIRKVAPGGIITTMAGNGQFGFSGDGGPATSATIQQPYAVALDAQGNLYIADYGNGRIRKVNLLTGVISTVAGGGPSGGIGDGGPATSANLTRPYSVAVDTAGNLYIADYDNQRIRKVTTGGIISTVAGNGGTGFSGDGGPATSAQLSSPEAVAVDAAGNLYIADNQNGRIRKVNVLTGVISTVAGNGTFGFSGDGGPATSAHLSSPMGVLVDAAGNLYIGDTYNHCIRKVTPDGTISTVAGVGGHPGFSGDNGPATSAQLTYPEGMALDAAGNLYIADTTNQRVRKVTPAAAPPTVNPGGLVNGASFSKLPPAAATIASLFGTNFGTSVTVATSLPLPTALGGVSVIIKPVTTGQSAVAPKSVLPVGGINAPLFSVSPGQINFQVPVELADQTQATVAVSLNGVIGNSIVFNVTQYNPAIFATNQQGSGQGVILIASTGELAAPSGSIPGRAARPAKRGEYITIYCTGLGPVTNQPADGVPASSNPLSVTTTNANVTLGSVPVPATDGFFSGLAPSFVGLYQVNLQIPQDAPTGDAVPLALIIGGVNSNTVTIAVQ